MKACDVSVVQRNLSRLYENNIYENNVSANYTTRIPFCDSCFYRLPVSNYFLLGIDVVRFYSYFMNSSCDQIKTSDPLSRHRIILCFRSGTFRNEISRLKLTCKVFTRLSLVLEPVGETVDLAVKVAEANKKLFEEVDNDAEDELRPRKVQFSENLINFEPGEYHLILNKYLSVHLNQ